MTRSTVTCPTATSPLAAAPTSTCTASYTITQADIDAGSVTNTATATDGSVTSNTDSVDGRPPPRARTSTWSRRATPTTYDAVGDVIDYTYVVTNTGNVTLDGPVTVDDDKVTVTCPAVATLDPGDHVTCTASHTITQADIDAGSVTNTATASADGIDSTDDIGTVNAAQGPDLELVKTATPATYDSVGDVITYTYVVTNTGNVTLTAPSRSTTTDDRDLPGDGDLARSVPTSPARRRTRSPRPTSTPDTSPTSRARRTGPDVRDRHASP